LKIKKLANVIVVLVKTEIAVIALAKSAIARIVLVKFVVILIN